MVDMRLVQKAMAAAALRNNTLGSQQILFIGFPKCSGHDPQNVHNPGPPAVKSKCFCFDIWSQFTNICSFQLHWRPYFWTFCHVSGKTSQVPGSRGCYPHFGNPCPILWCGILQGTWSYFACHATTSKMHERVVMQTCLFSAFLTTFMLWRHFITA